MRAHDIDLPADSFDIVDPRSDAAAEGYATRLHRQRERKGVGASRGC